VTKVFPDPGVPLCSPVPLWLNLFIALKI
jgi:hypothetical protein